MNERASTGPAGAKERDYWFTVLLTDPLAVPLVRLFARLGRPHPDHVTAIALVLGLAVGLAFSLGGYAGLVAGAVLFYLAFVFDCVDGKLARALGITSARGKALDQLADGGRRASASLGLVVYLWRTEGDVTVLWAVVYAVVAYYFVEISGATRGPQRGGVSGRVSQALARRRLLPNPGMPDVQAVAFIFGPVTSLVVPGLAVGIAMVGVAILLTVYRRLRHP